MVDPGGRHSLNLVGSRLEALGAGGGPMAAQHPVHALDP